MWFFLYLWLFVFGDVYIYIHPLEGGGGGGFNNQTGPILFHIYPLIYTNLYVRYGSNLIRTKIWRKQIQGYQQVKTINNQYFIYGPELDYFFPGGPGGGGGGLSCFLAIISPISMYMSNKEAIYIAGGCLKLHIPESSVLWSYLLHCYNILYEYKWVILGGWLQQTLYFDYSNVSRSPEHFFKQYYYFDIIWSPQGLKTFASHLIYIKESTFQIWKQICFLGIARTMKWLRKWWRTWQCKTKPQYHPVNIIWGYIYLKNLPGIWIICQKEHTRYTTATNNTVWNKYNIHLYHITRGWSFSVFWLALSNFT